MASRSLARALVGLLIVEALLFVVSLPGLGVETRKFPDYTMWGGPILLGLLLVIFAGVIGGLAVAKRTSNGTASAGILVAVVAIISVLFDYSAIAGPPDPFNSLLLSVVVIIVSVAILAAAGNELRNPPATTA